MRIAATGSPMHEGRHCVLGRILSPRLETAAASSAEASQDAVPAWRASRIRAGFVATVVGALAVTSLSLTAPAAADEVEEPPAAAPVANERLPRVTEPVEKPAGDGLLPWTTVAANDLRGYRASTYTGTYFDRRFEQYRLCVFQREGGGSYTLVYRSFHGAYQFGTAYNSPSRVASRLRAELIDTYGVAAERELNRLASTPISRWNRFWQDAAFWTVFNRGAGWRQWSSQWGANWHCDHRPNAEKGWPNPSRYNYSPIERGGLNKVARAYRDTQPAPRSSSQVSATNARTKTPQQIREAYGRSRAPVGSPQYSRWLARNVIADRHGWGVQEFRALRAMWHKESNWRYEVVNWHVRGPWYGLGQVNGPYIMSRGYSIAEYRNDPYIQIRVGADYIKGRYGTPRAAWKFWRANGWY
jgi:hypothetical protein